MITNIEDYTYLNTLSSYKITKNFFNQVYVYIENNEILGFIDYSVMYERAEINYIFVREQYRKKHIGFKLLQYVLDKINCDEITLEVNINNKGAINLYEKSGFEKIAIRKKYYDGEDGIIMIKRR